MVRRQAAALSAGDLSARLGPNMLQRRDELGDLAVFLSAAAAAVMSGLGSALLLILVAGLVGLVFLIWQGVAQSDPNENRYGPPAAPTTF